MEHPYLYSYFFVNISSWMFHEKNILMLYEYLIVVCRIHYLVLFSHSGLTSLSIVHFQFNVV